MTQAATADLHTIAGREHWTSKGDVKLFLWQKPPAAGVARNGTILFVHG